MSVKIKTQGFAILIGAFLIVPRISLTMVMAVLCVTADGNQCASRLDQNDLGVVEWCMPQIQFRGILQKMSRWSVVKEFVFQENGR